MKFFPFIFGGIIIAILLGIIFRGRSKGISWSWLGGATFLVLLGWGALKYLNRPRESDEPDREVRDTRPASPAPTYIQQVAGSGGTFEFPVSGEGHATKTNGVRAWLDPIRTSVFPSQPARYVFVEDTVVFFDDTEGARVDRTPHHQVWLDMPAGRYIIYPLGNRDRIFVRWWQ